MKRVCSSFATVVLLAILSLLVLETGSARASITAVGSPVITGSWSQGFSEGAVGNFDHVQIHILSGGPFEAPAVQTGFDVVGWSQAYSDVNYSVGDGPTTTGLNWTINFQGTPASPLSFLFQAYDGATLKDQALATWDGSSWSFPSGPPWDGVNDYRFPRVHNVTQNTWFRDIVPAVAAAMPSDLLKCYPGTYTEQVVINGMDLTIQGSGPALTTIQSPVALTTFFSTGGPNNYPIVLAENSTDIRIEDLTIDGAGLGNGNARFLGIAFWNAGGKLLNCDVKGVRNTPFDGAQHGVAVYANTNTGGPYSLEVGQCNLTDWQKNGTVFNGSGMSVDFHDCTVTGQGPTALNAENGVQVSGAASCTITNCTISGSYYTGGGFTAAGALMFQAGTVNMTGTSITNCQSASYYLETNGSMTGCNVTNGVSGGIGTWGAILDNEQASAAYAARREGASGASARPVAAPYDDAGASALARPARVAATLYTLAISGGCYTGPGVAGSYGIDVYSAGGGASCTMTGAEVTAWEYGVLVENPGASMNADHNAITGNLFRGWDGTTGGPSQNATLNWWGNAGGPGVGGSNPVAGGSVVYSPWLLSGTDTNPGCGFAPGPDNIISAGPAPSCISLANPCITIPVTISRTTSDNVRGFSVTVQLSANLALCTPATPASSIFEGTYLSSVNPFTNFQVIDNGGGNYTVDCAILGTPCGATAATGGLFTIDVKKNGPDGIGTVTLGPVLLRDCSNVAVVASAGAPLNITIDTAAPGAITDLAAVRQLSGNGAISTAGLIVSWATGGAGTVKLYRAPFGSYPEYDDDGPLSPPNPALAPGGPWGLVSASATSPYTDTAAPRGYWYYVALITDGCGNVSPVSNMTGGLLNYLLGDVADGTTPGIGDNTVDGLDISLLGTYYGIVGEVAVDAVGYLDVGPTETGAATARPKPDDKINFEDLIIFAINYGGTGYQAPAARAATLAAAVDAVRVEAPGSVSAGQEVTARVMVEGAGDIQGLSAQLGWDAAVVTPVEVSASRWLAAQNGVVLSAGPGSVDAALLGVGRAGLSGTGELATVRFRVLASGNPKIALAAVTARDAQNRAVGLGRSPAGAREALPGTTELLPAAPNPFADHATLSFSLAQGGAVELAIFSVDGRRVRTLVNEERAAGTYRLSWNGTDAQGHRLGAGLYYARLVTAQGHRVRKVMLIR